MPDIVLSSSEGTGCHMLKAECERAAGLASADESINPEECGAPRRAIVFTFVIGMPVMSS
jgi:hypothetical protein